MLRAFFPFRAPLTLGLNMELFAGSVDRRPSGGQPRRLRGLRCAGWHWATGIASTTTRQTRLVRSAVIGDPANTGTAAAIHFRLCRRGTIRAADAEPKQTYQPQATHRDHPLLPA